MPITPKYVSSIVSRMLAVALSLGLLFACANKMVYEEDIAPVAVQRTVSYQSDIQPIFDNKCVACHACNDAPCQLKLSSAEGVDRGASKIKVYDGTREEDLPPTRLGIDALNTKAWRQIGFFSARYQSEDPTSSVERASLLMQMVELGHKNPWAPNRKVANSIELGRERENQCPTIDEFDDFAEDRPLQGMPLAMTGLSDKEYRTLQSWVAEGSVVEPSKLKPSNTELHAIGK